MHTNFVFLLNKNDKGQVFWQKARVMVCRNEQTDYEEDMFSPVENHFVIKFILSLSMEQDAWYYNFILITHFKIAFCVDRYMENWKQKFFQARGNGSVMKLQWILCRLKHATKVLSNPLFKTSVQPGYEEMETVPCLLFKKRIIIICSIADLFLFEKQELMIDHIKEN